MTYPTLVKSKGECRLTFEKTIIFHSNRSIALARCSLQRLSIQHYDRATFIIDRSHLAEGVRGHADTGPPHTEHAREKVLSYCEFVLLHAIVGEQQPAREALFECVGTVAGR